MRCKTCDYSLWGLSGRTCPECGAPFKPSDFRFVPNTVRFLCPHCAQQYFGTTATGHLDPPEFDCVSCGAHIHMDEMILEPREGVKDERTRPDQNPWLQRPRLKLRSAYYRTIGRSIGYPLRLARGTPDDSPVMSALGFFAIHVACISLVTVVPIAVLLMGLGRGHWGSRFLLPMLILLGVPTVGFFGVLFLWSLLTHMGLRLLAGRAVHLPITIKALAYASAPLLLMAVPCLSMHLAIFAIPWWCVNAIVMVAAMHRIAWWRAMIAHLIAGMIVMAIPIAGIWALLALQPFSTFAGPGMSPASRAGATLQSVVRQIRTPGQNEHLIELLVRVPGWNSGLDDLVRSTINPPQVMIGPYTLDAFLIQPHPVRDPMVADLRAAVRPDGVHRLGHIVVCDVGVNLRHVQGPDLWIAVVWPDPDSTAVFIQPETVTVILASGAAQDIPLAQFPADLAAQNVDRRSYGIAEIPDPATIHMWPPGSQFAPPSVPPTPVP